MAADSAPLLLLLYSTVVKRWLLCYFCFVLTPFSLVCSISFHISMCFPLYRWREFREVLRYFSQVQIHDESQASVFREGFGSHSAPAVLEPLSLIKDHQWNVIS